MPIIYHEFEERILNAVAHVQVNPDSIIWKIARDFDVLPQRLRYRLKPSRSKMTESRQNKKLSHAEALALYRILDRLDICGFPARVSFVKNFANDILRRSSLDPSSDPPTVNPMWPQRFPKRHPRYSVRKLKPLATERQKTSRSYGIFKLISKDLKPYVNIVISYQRIFII
jgi:hypothetical protein